MVIDENKFWEVKKNGSVSITQNKLYKFLQTQGGFSMFRRNGQKKFILVREHKGIVDSASPSDMKDFIKNWITEKPDCDFVRNEKQDLLEAIHRGHHSLFCESALEFMDKVDINFLKSDAQTSYHPFKNGVVKVTKNDYVLIPYNDLTEKIWKSQIIDFEIEVQNLQVDIKCEFAEFMSKAIGIDENFTYAKQVAGYLMHPYKDKARPYAVIIGEKTETDDKGGGTGKGIFVQAISKIARSSTIDGKLFDPANTFAFQRVDIDTQLVVVDDVKKTFIFESFYNPITTGITIERKNKDQLFVPFEDSPKFVFTTNYTIKETGEHSKRRRRNLEFEPYYNSTRTPFDEFGHLLFEDWDRDEWIRFYNFMLSCIRLYLEKGIEARAASDAIRRKGMIQKYGKGFLEWWDMNLEEFLKAEKLLLLEQWNDFLHFEEIEKKEYSKQKFNKAIEEACIEFGYQYEEWPDRQNKNKKAYKITRGADPERLQKIFQVQNFDSQVQNFESQVQNWMPAVQEDLF